MKWALFFIIWNGFSATQEPPMFYDFGTNCYAAGEKKIDAFLLNNKDYKRKPLFLMNRDLWPEEKAVSYTCVKIKSLQND